MNVLTLSCVCPELLKVRINLILDIWHPDLTEPEVKFLTVLQQAKMALAKQHMMQDVEGGNDTDNFYKVIEKAKGLPPNQDLWWVN